MLLAYCLITLAAITAATLLLARKLHRLRRQLRRHTQQLWQTHNIFQLFDGAAPLPLPGGWAASTDLLDELLRVVATREPRLIVELGSGLSTLVLAAALRRRGAGRLLAVEAEEAYAERTRTLLRAQGLSAWATVRTVPLIDLDFEGQSRPWYDTALLADLAAIDLLFIDGPPTERRTDIRYPALPFFWPRLNAGAVVLLDDADRPAEQSIARQWQRAFPAARFEPLRFEKGALRITRP